MPTLLDNSACDVGSVQTEVETFFPSRAANLYVINVLPLQVPAAFALAVSASLVACASSAGVVRLFAARTLAFKGNLPRPTSRTAGTAAAAAACGAAGAAGAGPATSASAGALFPDAVSLSFDATGERLTVLYSDRSVVVWDVRNPGKVVRHRSVLSHAGIVWGAALVPSWQAALLGQQAAPGAIGFAPMPGPHAGGAGAGAGACAGEGAGASPSSVLVTCGTDGSVRLWNVCLDNSASTAGPLGLPAELAGAAKITRTLRGGGGHWRRVGTAMLFVPLAPTD